MLGRIPQFAFAILALMLLALGIWLFRPGFVSHWNYERISKGMTREQVEFFLGSKGKETKFIKEFPFPSEMSGAPPGWTGVVWGDQFFIWKTNRVEIYVGFSEGRVTSKYYWEAVP